MAIKKRDLKLISKNELIFFGEEKPDYFTWKGQNDFIRSQKHATYSNRDLLLKNIETTNEKFGGEYSCMRVVTNEKAKYIRTVCKYRLCKFEVWFVQTSAEEDGGTGCVKLCRTINLWQSIEAVSYTHLTLPTKRIV